MADQELRDCPSRVNWSWRDWAAVIMLTVVALAASWPIVPLPRMGRELYYGDATTAAYIVGWIADTWWRHPLNVFNLPAFFPHRSALANADAMLLPAALATPFWLASGSFILTYNSAVLLSVWVALVSCYYTLRHIGTTNIAAAAAGAIAMAVNSDRYWHSAGHLNLLWTGVLPLGFLGGWLLALRPSWRSAFAAAVFTAAALSCSWYLLVFACACALAGFVAAWTVAWSRPTLQSAKWTAPALLLSALLMSPIAAVYVRAQASVGAGTSRAGLAENERLAATVPGWLRPPNLKGRLVTILGKRLGKPGGDPARGEDSQFIGYALMLVLACESLRLAIRAFRRRLRPLDRLSVFAFSAAMASAVFSLGPYWGPQFGKMPYYYLHQAALQYTGFFRNPSRFAFLFQFFSAVSVAVFLASVGAKSRRLGHGVAGLLMIAIVAEHWPIEMSQRYRPASNPAVAGIKEYDPSGTQAFIFLPDPMNCSAGFSAKPLWRPMVNGWSDAPCLPEHSVLMSQMEDFPSTRALAQLDKSRIHWIVLAQSALIERARRDARLELVMSAPNGSLFRICRLGAALAEWERMRLRLRQAIELQRNEIMAKLGVAVPNQPDGTPGERGIVCAKPVWRPDTAAVIRVETGFSALLRICPQKPVFPQVTDVVLADFTTNADLSEANVRIYWAKAGEPLSERHAMNGQIERDATTGAPRRAVFPVCRHADWFTGGPVAEIRIVFDCVRPGADREIAVSEVCAGLLAKTPEVPF